jgi:hypothetical protein
MRSKIIRDRGTKIAVTSNWSTAKDVPISLIIFTMMIQAIRSSETSVLTRFPRYHPRRLHSAVQHKVQVGLPNTCKQVCAWTRRDLWSDLIYIVGGGRRRVTRCEYTCQPGLTHRWLPRPCWPHFGQANVGEHETSVWSHSPIERRKTCLTQTDTDTDTESQKLAVCHVTIVALLKVNVAAQILKQAMMSKRPQSKHLKR